jgi:hypothetical protein
VSKRITITLSDDAAAIANAMAKLAGVDVAVMIAGDIAELYCVHATAARRGKRSAGAMDRSTDAERRSAILWRWIRAGRPQLSFEGISRATLYNWERRWQGSGEKGLIDRRSTIEPRAQRFAEFIRETLSVYRSGAARVTLAEAYRQASVVAARDRLPMCSYKTVQRAIADALFDARISQKKSEKAGRPRIKHT